MNLEPLDESGQAVDRFYRAATRFHSLVGDETDADLSQRIGEIAISLSELYATACALSRIQGPFRSVDVDDHYDDETWKHAYDNLRRGLGRYDRYWVVENPMHSSQPVEASLADDLADIYVETDLVVRGGAQPIESGAILGWRLAFETHWGVHAIRAMNILHYLLARKEARFT